MKNLFLNRLFVIIFIIFTAIGCAILKPTKQNSQSQNKISKEENKLNSISNAIEANKDEKINQTAIYAYGVGYSLSQIDVPSLEVTTASRLNDRIISIVGAPDLKEAERIKKTIDLLNSEIQKEREKGEKLLLDKDKEIFLLQKQQKELELKYESQISQTLEEAKKIAKGADEAKTTLDSMSGMMGLRAVFWGLKQFFITSLTWIIAFLIIFAILRVLSATNPIAASIFSVFNVIGSMILSLFKMLTPKALELSKLVSSEEKSKYKNPLIKIVDVIQEFKEEIKKDPNKHYSLNEILIKLNGDMDQSEKDVIDEILVEEKWRKK